MKYDAFLLSRLQYCPLALRFVRASCIVTFLAHRIFLAHRRHPSCTRTIPRIVILHTRRERFHPSMPAAASSPSVVAGDVIKVPTHNHRGCSLLHIKLPQAPDCILYSSIMTSILATSDSSHSILAGPFAFRGQRSTHVRGDAIKVPTSRSISSSPPYISLSRLLSAALI